MLTDKLCFKEPLDHFFWRLRPESRLSHSFRDVSKTLDSNVLYMWYYKIKTLRNRNSNFKSKITCLMRYSTEICALEAFCMWNLTDDWITRGIGNSRSGVATIIPSLNKAPYFLQNPCGRHGKHLLFFFVPDESLNVLVDPVVANAILKIMSKL